MSYRLGIAFEDAGNPQRARAAYEKATAPGAKFPEVDDARRRLASLGGRVSR